MDALIEKWESQLSPNLAKNTRLQYRHAVEKIRSAFAEFSPADILPTDVAQYLDALKATPNMANRIRSVLKVMMDCAVRWGMASSNPVVSIKRHEEKQRDRYITDEEYNAIYSMSPYWMQLIIEACYLTGQRIQDVLSIKFSDISEEGVYFQQQKTGQRLLVRATPELKNLVARATEFSEQYPGTEYLLPARGGKKRVYSVVRDGWKAACQQAEVQDAHLHDLRAKALTDADAQGLNAQRLGGHTTAAMTERYLRLRRTIVAESPKMGGQKEDKY